MTPIDLGQKYQANPHCGPILLKHYNSRTITLKNLISEILIKVSVLCRFSHVQRVMSTFLHRCNFMKIPQLSHFTASLKWLPWFNKVMTGSGDEIHCFVEDIIWFIFVRRRAYLLPRHVSWRFNRCVQRVNYFSLF